MEQRPEKLRGEGGGAPRTIPPHPLLSLKNNLLKYTKAKKQTLVTLSDFLIIPVPVPVVYICMKFW